ncbi:hypothetical protein LB507_001442 [Fusarium sp. FIESC RH6]|nr:hypothetical protein LB507_001442 [Fusarium sp. FIESC RH6]
MLEPTTYQLYYPVGTPRPAWDLVKPGRVSLSGRREDHKVRINEWIESCNSTHQGCVVKDAKLPRRVLDLGAETNHRIYLHVSENEVAPYVALSHCWGKGPVLQTTTDTVTNHTHEISYHSLPKSFKDAVTVTRNIGVRYLWIDSLCIIQDDTLDWEIESSKMASIYSNAFLVLAASQASESSEGFIDRKDIDFKHTWQLDPRRSAKIAHMKNPDSTTSEIYSRPMSIGRRSGESYHRWKVTTSPLNRRGWVLQESILARRIVHFTASEMVWECVQCLKCECMEIEADESEATYWSEFNMARNSRMKHPGSERIPRINGIYVQWRELLGSYGTRVLSKDADRLPALSGLAKHCQSQGAGKYLAGLWKNDLLKSLVWHPRTDEPVQRWEEYMAPTWSPFSVGYIERLDGLREAGYWYCYEEGYHKRWGKPQAQILEAQCVPSGEDPTGAVKDGFLVLRGAIKKDNPDSPDHIWMMSDSDESDSDDPLERTAWSYISWDRPTEQIERSEMVFFLLWADFKKGYIKALYLVPVQGVPGTYTRIGIVDSHFGDKGLAKFLSDVEVGEVKIV